MPLRGWEATFRRPDMLARGQRLGTSFDFDDVIERLAVGACEGIKRRRSADGHDTPHLNHPVRQQKTDGAPPPQGRATTGLWAPEGTDNCVTGNTLGLKECLVRLGQKLVKARQPSNAGPGDEAPRPARARPTLG